MKRILSFISLLLSFTLTGEGFVTGTVVKTPRGHTPIEELSRAIESFAMIFTDLFKKERLHT